MKKVLLVVFVFMSVLSSSVRSMELEWDSEKSMNQFRVVFFSENPPFSVARRLIEKKDFNINQAINEHGDRLVHEVLNRRAVWEKEDLKRFTFLVEYGAMVDLRNNKGKTPFDLVREKDDTIFTPWFAQCGYKFLPISIKPKRNPINLLLDGAYLYKRLYKQCIDTDDVVPATDDGVQATNILAEFFMFIRNNENNRLNGQRFKYYCEDHPGIMIDHTGYFLSHTTFEDVIQLFGKEGVDFVMCMLEGMCKEAGQEKNMDSLHEIQTMYPFVTLYRAKKQDLMSSVD